MAFTEDFTVFLNTADFAVTGTLNGVSVNGIFDRAFEVATAGVGFASSNPGFQLSSSDVPASPVGKTLVVNSTSYTVVEAHPDGTGMTTLLLEAA